MVRRMPWHLRTLALAFFKNPEIFPQLYLSLPERGSKKDEAPPTTFLNCSENLFHFEGQRMRERMNDLSKFLYPLKSSFRRLLLCCCCRRGDEQTKKLLLNYRRASQRLLDCTRKSEKMRDGKGGNLSVNARLMRS
jgi:hypothetical protein